MNTRRKYYFLSEEAAHSFAETRKDGVKTSIHHEDKYWPRGSTNKYQVWITECWWPEPFEALTHAHDAK